MKKFPLFILCLIIGGCGVTVRTPYGEVSYDQAATRGDGKTVLR